MPDRPERDAPSDPEAATTNVLGEDSGFPIEEDQALRRLKASLLGRESEPLSIDRYTLLEPLGSGGMGIVYRADDPELHRQVAIKVLLTVGRGAQATEGRERLMLEAQAIAQLSHPNVVAVYDVGRFTPGDVFPEQPDTPALYIVMELIEGEDVASWIRSGERSWREVLRVFTEAGNGLAAAHARDLVHRDFKPANVLLGEDGRPRVVDFGLARVGDDSSGVSSARLEHAGLSREPLSGSLTATGTVLGTPAYMSPEQHRGRPADHRADQYAFCVSLYEGLYGQRPFHGKSLAELHESKTKGPAASPPRADVPTWIHRALVRGLAPDPEQRWPSMVSLLEELARDPAAKRRRFALGGVAIAIVGLGAVGTYGLAEQQAHLCTAPTQRWAGVWDEARRGEIEAAFVATGSPHAASSFERAASGLDAFVSSWNEAHIEACTATRVTGAQSERVLELRVRCLERIEAESRTQLEVLAAADAEVLDRAITAVGSLTPPSTCTNPLYYLADLTPPPPESADAVATIRDGLARVKALLELGQNDPGLELARSSLAQAESLGYEPLSAEAQFWVGRMLSETGEPAASIENLETAYYSGLGSGHDMLASKAAFSLIDYTSRAGELEAARTWARHASEMLRRTGDLPERRAALAHARGNLYVAQGKHEAALEEHRNSLRLREELHGADHPSTGIAVNSVGRLLVMTGEAEEGTREFERALSIWRRTYGDDHPLVADALTNVAIGQTRQGNHDAAIPYFEQALALRSRLLGDDHPQVGFAVANLGMVFATVKRHEDALARLKQAQGILEAKLERDHPQLSSVRVNVAVELSALGRHEDAIGMLEPAIESQKRKLGDDHRTVGQSLVQLGGVRAAAGDPQGARADIDRAIEIFEAQPDSATNAAQARELLARLDAPED